MAKKKDRTGLIIFLIFLAVVGGVGGYFGWGWYRVSQEREKWGGLVARLVPAFNEAQERVAEVEPDTVSAAPALKSPVLVWSRNDERVLHLPATEGREATDPAGDFTIVMVHKTTENTGTYMLGSSTGVRHGTAPAKQYVMYVAVIDPREGTLLSAHKIFGSPPPDYVKEAYKGLTGPDDVRKKLNAWLRGGLR